MVTNCLAITTSSLGLAPSHALPEKIQAAAENGFSLLEIVYQDLADYASSSNLELSLKNAARSVASLCSSSNIGILSLNPFKNFEGHNTPLADRLESARHWIEVASTLGAKYLQVPSQFDANSSGDWDVMIDDLRQLSDLAASYSVGIAYEAVAWGCYVNTWEDSYRVVRDVGRANFGICLDSFHIVARLWGDNTEESGVRRNAEMDLQDSLEQLVKCCPLESIFYVQLSDGERYEPPLTPSHRFYQPGFPPSLTWSRNTRPFPLESEYGAYFPVDEVAKACLKHLGWEGVVSMEIFDWRMRKDSNRPAENAARGRISWEKLLEIIKKDTQ